MKIIKRGGNNNMGKLKVFECFAGVGSQRMALRNLGIDFEVVGISEIDVDAIISYAAICGVDLNKDINMLDKIIDKIKKMRVGKECPCLTSREYKNPQRVLVTSKLINNVKSQMRFDRECCDSSCNETKILDIGNCITARYDSGIQNYKGAGIAVVEKILIPQATKKGYIEMEVGGVYDLTYPNSKTRRGRVQENGNICPTLTSSTQDIVNIDEQYRVRKLTPLECWRLMSFTDEDFYKAKNAGISNSQLYRQAGNSIVVKVLEGIFENMFLKENRDMLDTTEVQREDDNNMQIKWCI